MKKAVLIPAQPRATTEKISKNDYVHQKWKETPTLFLDSW